MGSKSVQNVAGYYSSKATTFAFFYSLIRDVGEATARKSYAFNNIDQLIDAPLEELAEVDDVGPVVASHIRAFFEVKRNRSYIDLVTLGVHCRCMNQIRIPIVHPVGRLKSYQLDEYDEKKHLTNYALALTLRVQ